MKGILLHMVLLFGSVVVYGQGPAGISADDPVRDTVSPVLSPVDRYNSAIKAILNDHTLLNSNGKPFVNTLVVKPITGKEHLFYLLAALFLYLALLRFIFARYSFNLFRVFFNTSLRQGQLTDQLLQARLPSLFFNLFFILSAGMFAYLLLSRMGWLGNHNAWWLAIPSCTGIVAAVYGTKYLTLKFTGWLTNFKEPVDTYIFIVFLINKIIGILLLPAILLLAFAKPGLSYAAAQGALVVIGLLLVLRFFRSYGLLQGRLKVSRAHFLLYIFGIEILPLLLIYKALVIYLEKSI